MWRLRRCGGRRWRLRLIPRRAAPTASAERDATPRILLVAIHQSYRIAAYQSAAEALGARLVIASQGEHSLIPGIAEGIHIAFSDVPGAVQRIVAEAGRAPFDAVVASDDLALEVAARAAGALGLAHNALPAVRASRRKDIAREVLRAAGLPVPRFRRLHLRRALAPQIAGLRYPCVVKPLAMAASRGVVRVDSRQELLGMLPRLEAIVAEALVPDEREQLLVESFIPGEEIAIEGLLSAGRLHVLAVFDKPEPLDGPFFEESYYVTPSRLPKALLDRATRRLAEACAAYGLREGPVHAELRLHDGEAWIVEVAARTIGGDCARLLSFGTGRSLEELVLRHALGWPLALDRPAGAAGVLMIPTPAAGTLRRVEGVLAARQVPGIEDLMISIREGYELTPLPEGGAYLGFMFAHADTPAEVETALREAHACLNVVIAPRLPVAMTATS
ncbi:MAG: ATP-grasp domain-containing protein [Gammaproteobacteria bacterium]|nr:ATP-grasp domain-containing protein [Gammaproteobacteria bacterium]NIO24299.1 ATP-grasp domain-containing protein [Gammaproteobacteria bacterium]NIP47675.1 ATP-grasp domain-containing protein [Gammaproteobacteria bacterium]NIP90302.1 ATP-grasp domain-containing protein [Gammaproteobacteria bacterium]NIR22229.1 ATP-grasp domain-containing protein [Gammaproteobacteria bacterium]